ncbi:kinase-like protein [Phaffia rhodozyma]|uniref:Kinase-like protein n=1 Tax=Phaffia rhodozyma TaxID=264483 RepID=A0A0F7SET6_PHARH|nr:kinase-like protein [Phaffia rhodozyma]
MEWDAIPYDQIIWGEKLGQGSFGVVFRGTYLGVDIAIKEVLPLTDYEVAKYFEREWRIMREARHPNVVQYLGLSRAPPPDGRTFIISECIENGNLRSYIWDKRTYPDFPWRLRISFATDIARALAYLHARKCIHRDLKGENLLITANKRIKMTDFGFARIVARNEDEMKRMSYCGTDGYILSRDHHSNTFKRTMPTFELDIDEVRDLASPGCPEAFIDLALECATVEPKCRPKMEEVLRRLRVIELDVLSREKEVEHVGSLKLVPRHKSNANKRIPSFGQEIGKELKHSTSSGHKPSTSRTQRAGREEDGSTEDEDGDMDQENLKDILKDLGRDHLRPKDNAHDIIDGEKVREGGARKKAKWGNDPVVPRIVGDDEGKEGGNPSVYEDANETMAIYTPSVPSNLSFQFDGPDLDENNTATIILPRSSTPAWENHESGSTLTIRERITVDPKLTSLINIPSEIPITPPPVEAAHLVDQAASPPPVHASPTRGYAFTPSIESDAFSPPDVPTSISETYPSKIRAVDLLARVRQLDSHGRPSTSSTSGSKPHSAQGQTQVQKKSTMTHRFTLIKPSLNGKIAPVTGLIGWGNWFSNGLAGSMGSGLSSAGSTTFDSSRLGAVTEGGHAGKLKCGVCKIKVKPSRPFMCCDDCKQVVHIKCSINKTTSCQPVDAPSTAY